MALHLQSCKSLFLIRTVSRFSQLHFYKFLKKNYFFFFPFFLFFFVLSKFWIIKSISVHKSLKLKINFSINDEQITLQKLQFFAKICLFLNLRISLNSTSNSKEKYFSGHLLPQTLPDFKFITRFFVEKGIRICISRLSMELEFVMEFIFYMKSKTSIMINFQNFPVWL